MGRGAVGAAEREADADARGGKNKPEAPGGAAPHGRPQVSQRLIAQRPPSCAVTADNLADMNPERHC